MRSWTVVSVAAMTLTLLLSVATVKAETRVFVLANQSDGYGVDRCLALNERCGNVVANAYCQTQNYSEAISYRKVEREEISESTIVNACRGACRDLVAIECVR